MARWVFANFLHRYYFSITAAILLSALKMFSDIVLLRLSEMLKDSIKGYGLITVFLHWGCAGLIIFLFGLGIYMRSLDYYSPWYNRGPALHISLGILVMLLMCLRVIWRTCNSTPEKISTINTQQHRAASVVKIILYLFTFTVCCTGYLITTSDNQAAHFFEWFSIPPSLALNAPNVDRAGALHKYIAWGIMGLVLLHGGAALYHHFIKRDRTLVRMLKPINKPD